MIENSVESLIGIFLPFDFGRYGRYLPHQTKQICSIIASQHL